MEKTNTLSEKIQQIIASVKPSVSIRSVSPAEEADDTRFILYYGLYKDLASTNRQHIPTYYTVHQVFKEQQDDSLLFFAMKEDMEIASLWVTIEEKTATIHGIGSIQSGIAEGIHYLLLSDAITYARKKDVETIFLGKDALLPFRKKDRDEVSQVFHEMTTL